VEEEVPLKAERERMVADQLRGRGITDERVLAAMSVVPRHEFIAPEWRHKAYEDCPLPIRGGQTISQPYMVAAMSAALRLQGHETVLDVGTGSGYQAAVLAQLAARVFSIERDPELLALARKTLTAVGLTGRITLVEGDGSLGLPEHAPYNGILVAAGAPRVPEPLIEQLLDGGRLVIPIGDRSNQDLVLVRKFSGQVVQSVINSCRFVPLLGAEGWPR
jgi:protein-L-isoaspartate(D-aspartate) O-methyltransferase